MNKPKPKFCVGEEVSVKGFYDPSIRCDKTEVTSKIYVSSVNALTKERNGKGWGYKTAHTGDNIWMAENSLSKLPPEDRTQWSDCEWMPKETVK